MEWIKSLMHRETPEEALKKHKRALDKTVRQLDRERATLLSQERKLTIDMKRMAKDNQIDSVRILAKDLVRTRRFAQSIYIMRAQLQGLSLRLTTLQATGQLATAMGGVARAMRSMNNNISVPGIQRIMAEFQRQAEVMGAKEEVMGDAIDSALDTEDTEEAEAAEEVSKVMDEIGLEFKSRVGISSSNTPMVTVGQGCGDGQLEGGDDTTDRELEDRLAALKTSMK